MQEQEHRTEPAGASGSSKSAHGLRIAFLDDDAEQAERISDLLHAGGHQVYVFSRGRALLGRLRTETYELIVLDWEVPDVSGYEVLRNIRTQLELRTPVLFLTHRDAEADVVQALEAGADDFLIKPPRARELLARVEAMGRRAREQTLQQVALDRPPFHIDLEGHRIERDGIPLELTRREFEVALLLFRNTGKVLSRGYIMDAVWGRPGHARTTRPYPGGALLRQCPGSRRHDHRTRRHHGAARRPARTRRRAAVLVA